MFNNGLGEIKRLTGKMNRKLFIPVTDDMLYEHPEQITAPLCPYQADRPTLHWLAMVESGSEHQDAKKPAILDQSKYRTWLEALGKPYTRLRRA